MGNPSGRSSGLLPFEALYKALRAKAARRSISFDLSYVEFLPFTTICECHYCGAFIPWKPYTGRDSRSASNAGGRSYFLDRKDNALGYVAENLIVCCQRCNLGKGTRFTYEEWRLIGSFIRSNPQSFK